MKAASAASASRDPAVAQDEALQRAQGPKEVSKKPTKTAPASAVGRRDAPLVKDPVISALYHEHEARKRRNDTWPDWPSDDGAPASDPAQADTDDAPAAAAEPSKRRRADDDAAVDATPAADLARQPKKAASLEPDNALLSMLAAAADASCASTEPAARDPQDVSVLDDAPDQPQTPEQQEGNRRRVAPFPFKLHQILGDLSQRALAWDDATRVLVVIDQHELETHVMPRYFATRGDGILKSFTRQLNYYGFVRVTGSERASLRLCVKTSHVSKDDTAATYLERRYGCNAIFYKNRHHFVTSIDTIRNLVRRHERQPSKAAAGKPAPKAAEAAQGPAAQTPPAAFAPAAADDVPAAGPPAFERVPPLADDLKKLTAQQKAVLLQARPRDL